MDVLWHFTSQTKQRRNGRLSEFFWKLGEIWRPKWTTHQLKKNSLIAINRLHSLHQRRFIVVERQCGRWLSLRAEWSAPFRIGFPYRILCLKTRRKRKAKYLADPLSLWRIVLRLESVQLSPGSTLNEIALFLLVLPWQIRLQLDQLSCSFHWNVGACGYLSLDTTYW